MKTELECIKEKSSTTVRKTQSTCPDWSIHNSSSLHICNAKINNYGNNSRISSETPKRSISTPIKLSRTPTATIARKNVRTPGLENREPNNSQQPSPESNTLGGDRYIPERRCINFQLANYLMNNPEASLPSDKPDTITTMVGDLSKYRIISYKKLPPESTEGHRNKNKVVYSCTKSSAKKSDRYIPKQPERILDAPDTLNDFYLKLLDWNNSDILAVALGPDVYLWNAHTGDTKKLLTVEEGDYVASVCWAPTSGGNHLAIGISTGVTQIWDVNKENRLRTLTVADNRISCMAWNSYILSNGCQDGGIYNHDVRVASSLVGTFRHEMEVCGLQWSPNGRMLASGGNDNLVHLWSNCYMGSGATAEPSSSSGSTPVMTLSQHQAAIKALAWCPWRSNCLATGGGTMDRSIRVWNTFDGNCMYHVDAKSQVSTLLWSAEYHELLSAHGYANNDLIIWKFPSFTKIAVLEGHTNRVLGAAMSADRTTVVSLGADETLRFWACFSLDEEKKKKQVKLEKRIDQQNPLRMTIR